MIIITSRKAKKQTLVSQQMNNIIIENEKSDQLDNNSDEPNKLDPPLDNNNLDEPNEEPNKINQPLQNDIVDEEEEEPDTPKEKPKTPRGQGHPFLFGGNPPVADIIVNKDDKVDASLETDRVLRNTLKMDTPPQTPRKESSFLGNPVANHQASKPTTDMIPQASPVIKEVVPKHQASPVIKEVVPKHQAPPVTEVVPKPKVSPVTEVAVPKPSTNHQASASIKATASQVSPAPSIKAAASPSIIAVPQSSTKPLATPPVKAAVPVRGNISSIQARLNLAGGLGNFGKQRPTQTKSLEPLEPDNPPKKDEQETEIPALPNKSRYTKGQRARNNIAQKTRKKTNQPFQRNPEPRRPITLSEGGQEDLPL